MANRKNSQASSGAHGFPWKHVIGYAFSIILTALALWAAFYSGFSTKMILIAISIFAFLQATVQLFMFMHVTETEDGPVQTGNMIHAFIAFLIIIVGSIWVMSFGMDHLHHYL